MPAFTLNPLRSPFMQANRLIPIAVLALAVACSDDATSPTSLTSAAGPLALQVDPSESPFTGTLNEANTPSGGHLQTGTIFCTVDEEDLSVTCSSYELAGVGHTDVDVHLDAVYSATVLCNNPAGGKNRNNEIEPHTTTFAASQDFNVPSTKNGRLTIPETSVSPGGTDEDLCPNGNWETVLTDLTLESFTYSLTFPGETGPALLISEP
jgi:hypothetical protein